MNSKLIALASAATIALTAVAIPNQAEARWRGGGWWIPGAVIGRSLSEQLSLQDLTIMVGDPITLMVVVPTMVVAPLSWWSLLR